MQGNYGTASNLSVISKIFENLRYEYYRGLPLIIKLVFNLTWKIYASEQAGNSLYWRA